MARIMCPSDRRINGGSGHFLFSCVPLTERQMGVQTFWVFFFLFSFFYFFGFWLLAVVLCNLMWRERGVK